MARGITRVLHVCWSIVGLGLALLLVLEGVSRAGFAILDAQRERRSSQVFRSLNPGEAWLNEFHREVAERRFQWQPYVYWRQVSIGSGPVNIDERGLRRTWNSASSPGADHLRLFMFGGTSMWGTGRSDESTIPSLVSKGLNRPGVRPIWVANYGQTGYVSTQDALALLLELRRGQVPDLVIFYHGFNDILSAWQSGVAGIPENEGHRMAEFNLRRRLNMGGFAEGLAIFRLSMAIVGRPTHQRSMDLALAESVVDAYFSNVRLVQALARDYRFSAVFFWQPSVYTKEHRSAWEMRASRLYDAAFFAEANRHMRRRLRSGAPGNVYDLSGVFDGEPTTVFMDPIHTTEKGSHRIAERIVGVIQATALAKKR